MENKDINLKKFFSVCMTVLLCTVTLFLLFSSVILSIIAFSPKAKIFGYSFYVSDADVLGTKIEKDALIISKIDNLTVISADDDYIVIKKLGGFIKNEASWFLIFVCTFFSTMFLIILLSEGKKAMQKYGEKRLKLEIEFKNEESDTISV